MSENTPTPTGWAPPRCVHGRIVLGCPHGDCPTQGAYLDQQEAAMADWECRQQEAARDLVRSFLGVSRGVAGVLWPDEETQ